MKDRVPLPDSPCCDWLDTRIDSMFRGTSDEAEGLFRLMLSPLWYLLAFCDYLWN